MNHVFQPITSVSNPLIKTLRALDRKKTRNETGLFLAEGTRLVQQGLENGWELDTLVASQDGLERPQIRAIAEQALETGARVIEARACGSLQATPSQLGSSGKGWGRGLDFAL